MNKQVNELQIKSYLKTINNSPSEYNNKNKIREEKKNFYFENIVNKLSKIEFESNTLDTRKELCINEYDNLTEKETDMITFDIYNHIINNKKPWNTFKDYISSDEKNRVENEELFVNNEEKKTISDDLVNLIYEKNKEYIDNYVNKNMNYYINMGDSNTDEVIRYVSNYKSIPFNCYKSGVLYAGTKYNEGYVNSFTEIPYGYWYKIDKHYDMRFENSEFEKDILFYGILNLPFEYFDSVYSQSQRYFDEDHWEKIIDDYEKKIEEGKKLIESENKIRDELEEFDDYNSDYDDIYLNPELYGTNGVDDEDCYYDIYSNNLSDSDLSDSD